MSLLYIGSSLKETITNCFLVGQTLSMSMEKQYTLGKYRSSCSWQCTIGAVQSHSVYIALALSQVVVNDHGWKKLVCKSSLLHVAIQCACCVMLYLYTVTS